MGITYSIDDNQGIIRETWTGDVSALDLATYWGHYLADPRVLSIRKTLVDLRDATPTFSGQQLSSLIREVVDPALKGRDWKTAIVVAQPVQFGVSRQYHAFAQHYSTDSIFSDPTAALAWLTAR